jgi:hypothetical protein
MLDFSHSYQNNKMKTKLSLLTIAFFLLIIVSSCKKDSTAVSLTKTQLLTQSPWEIKETVYDIGGTITEYHRGGTNTTGANYHTVRFTFNTNGTGTNRDGNGDTHPLTWQFTSTDFSTIHLVISASSTITADWSLVNVTDTVLSQSYISGSTLETATLIHVP